MSRTEAPPTPRRPRYRYILLEVLARPAPGRETVIQRLQTSAPVELGLWLTRYEDGVGIVRVPRDQLQAAREFFDASMGAEMRTLLTSGSIAGLQRHHRAARGLRQSRR